MKPVLSCSAIYWVLMHVVAIELTAHALIGALVAFGAASMPAADLETFRGATILFAWVFTLVTLGFGTHLAPHRWYGISVVALLLSLVATGLIREFFVFAPTRFWIFENAPALSYIVENYDLAIWPGAALAVLALHLRQVLKAAPAATYRGRYTALGLSLIVLYAAALLGAALVWPTLTGELAPPGPDAPPLTTPAHIVPEWHVLPFYAMLRSVPEKTASLIIFVAAWAVWVLPPLLDRGAARPFWRRPVMRWAVPALVVVMIALGALGAQTADGARLIAAQALTAAYFAFFLIATPLAGRANAQLGRQAH